MTRDEIIDMVKAKMDEITGFSSSEIDAVNLIEPLLDSASDKIRRIVPLHLIHPFEFPVDNMEFFPVAKALPPLKQGGFVPLPSDFLRLHSFQMKEWKVILTGDDVIDASHPKYKLQKYPHLRGGVWKPVIAIIHRTVAYSGQTPTKGVAKVLEFYSILHMDHDCPVHLYVNSTAAENNEDILLDPLTWQCAADVLATSNDFESSNAAQAKVVQFIAENTFK